MNDVYRIVRGSGMGGFLCPPGHPNLFFTVVGAATARKLAGDPHTMMSVDSAAKDDSGVPDEIRRQARELLETTPLVRSERWERNVYGYFRNSYSPDGENRNVQHTLRQGPPEHHLGFLCVREYFPDAEPRLDLIADAGGGYGTQPCLKCGKRLQYEAKVDGFAEAITCYMACPEGGGHEVAPLPAA